MFVIIQAVVDMVIDVVSATLPVAVVTQIGRMEPVILLVVVL